MNIYSVGKPFVPFIKEALYIKGIIASSDATMPMPKVKETQTELLKKIMEEYENEA